MSRNKKFLEQVRDLMRVRHLALAAAREVEIDPSSSDYSDIEVGSMSAPPPLKKQPALFLDRDGVLVHLVKRPHGLTAAWSDAEAVLIPEARVLVEAAKSLGAVVVVVTNQPDVADKTLSVDELDRIHARVRRYFGIEHIEYCPSRDNSDPRRKPNPGMILDAAARYCIDLQRAAIIGDSPKDTEAGRRAGIATIFLRAVHNRDATIAATVDCHSYAEAARALSALLGAGD